MDARVVLFFLIIFAHSIDGKTSKCRGSNPAKTGLWIRRQMALGREYGDIKDECVHRLAFEKNLRFIFAFNSNARKNPDNCTWQVGENELADKTESEFKSMLGFKTLRGFRGNSSSSFPAVLATSRFPKDYVIVDYSADNYMTPVKDQGNCGSCWAFSATGAIEAQVAMHEHILPNLSEQHLVDCANETYNNSGCDGGYMRGAFQFVVETGGVVTSDVYPYEGSQGECSPPTDTKYYNCSGYRVLKQDERELFRALLRYGPIACGIDGSLLSFQLYTTGVFADRQCSRDLNHAVLVVGAGTSEEGLDYWLVKNSWGTGWGEYGYGRLIRGVNICNIVGDCSYPYNCK